MLETLTILPMAPGTRSRRAEGLHRAPMLLSKQKPPAKPKPQQVVKPPTQPSKPAHHPPHSPPKHALHPPKSTVSSPTQLTIAAPSRSLQNILNHANSMRSKRKADLAGASDTATATVDGDAADAAARKRPRMSVEILTRPSSAGAGAKPAVGGAAAVSTVAQASPQATQAPPPKKATTNSANPTETHPVGASTAATSSAAASSLQPAARLKPTKQPAQTTQIAQPAPAITTISSPQPAQPYSRRPPGRPPSKKTIQPASSAQLAQKPKDKAVNGIKQELRNLHVTPEAVAAAAGPPEGGRKLRSQEASRFKSELSAYFPDYDEVIGNDPKEEHVLNVDTPILLVDSSVHYPTGPSTTTAPGALSSASPAFGSRADLHPTRSRASQAGLASRLPIHTSLPVRAYGDALFYELFDSHVLDFSFLGTQHNGRHTDDPLPDTYFESHHKRAERLERSIRNSEKGRAQHERDQIIRLLEGLQGPDWLRIMGVSGITETKKKMYEPAREHFIHGCRSILEKFRLWSLEEKRRKTERDKAHAEEVKARHAAEHQAASTVRGRGKGKAKATNAAASRAAAAAAERSAEKSAEKAHKSAKVGPRARRHSDRVDDSEAVEDEEEAEEEVGDDGKAEADDHDEEEDDDDDSQLDSSDVDAVIAKQLRAEALSRSRFASKSASKKPLKKPSKAASKTAPKTTSKATVKTTKKATTKKTTTTTADGVNKRRKLKHDKSATDSCLDPDTEVAEAPRGASSASQKKITSFFEKRQERQATVTRRSRRSRNAEADINLSEGAADKTATTSKVAGRKRPATRGSRKQS